MTRSNLYIEKARLDLALEALCSSTCELAVLLKILNLFEPHFIFCKGGYILGCSFIHSKVGYI